MERATALECFAVYSQSSCSYHSRSACGVDCYPPSTKPPVVARTGTERISLGGVLIHIPHPGIVMTLCFWFGRCPGRSGWAKSR